MPIGFKGHWRCDVGGKSGKCVLVASDTFRLGDVRDVWLARLSRKETWPRPTWAAHAQLR